MTPNPKFGAAAGSTDIGLVAARPAAAAHFVELFDRYADTLYHFARGLTGDSEDALRVVRRLFTIAWLKRRSIRFADDSALPWLLAACMGLALPSAVSRRRRFSSTTAASEIATVFVAVGELSAIDQQLCWLCIHEGRSYRAAAARLRITTFTARAWRKQRSDQGQPTDFREALS